MDSMGSTKGAHIEIIPRRSALLAEQDNLLEVLVRVCAPLESEHPERERPAMGIALVIDRSGSMGGAPLEAAKQCCEFVVQRLRDDDSLAFVQFDNTVQVLRPAAKLSRSSGPGPAERDQIVQRIRSIESGGGTDLHGGWLAGATELAPRAEGAQLQRVILLSDGQANTGETRPEEIVRQCRALAEAGVTTSTYGLGYHFNEALMVAMAEAGRGSHYYGATAEDLFEPFNRELDLLSSLWRQNVVLKVVPAPGVEVTMLNAHVPGDEVDSWRLPDIALGSEAWALLRLRVPRHGLNHPESLLRVVVSGRDIEQVRGESAQAMAALPVLPAAAYSVVAEDPEVVKRAAETEAGRLLLQCRNAARANDWDVVDALLADAKKRFTDHEWVSGVIASMSRLAAQRQSASLMKDALYSSMSLSRRLRSSVEADSLEKEGDIPSFLRRSMSSGTAEYIRQKLRDGDSST